MTMAMSPMVVKSPLGLHRVRNGLQDPAALTTYLTTLNWFAVARFTLRINDDRLLGLQSNKTPLYRAASEGRVDVLKVLLAAGADKEARDVVGHIRVKASGSGGIALHAWLCLGRGRHGVAPMSSILANVQMFAWYVSHVSSFYVLSIIICS